MSEFQSKKTKHNAFKPGSVFVSDRGHTVRILKRSDHNEGTHLRYEAVEVSEHPIDGTRIIKSRKRRPYRIGVNRFKQRFSLL